MNLDLQGEIPIDSENAIVLARRAIREAATSLGFGLTDVTRVVTAASELSRNIFQYAGSGVMRWRSITDGSRVGLELQFEDHGPGIADINRALELGYTSGGGLGLGLPGAKRLMDEMSIRSEPGKGTTVEARRWRRPFNARTSSTND